MIIQQISEGTELFLEITQKRHWNWSIGQRYNRHKNAKLQGDRIILGVITEIIHEAKPTTRLTIILNTVKYAYDN